MGRVVSATAAPARQKTQEILIGIVTFQQRMKQLLIFLALTPVIYGEDYQERTARNLSVFNVVSFPNSVCGAQSGYNGTCYTATECTTLGGTASGTCASSFGVCCVFSIACGGSTSANNSYAIMSSYSISTDSDPCTYTFCKTNNDVCKLRIDFDTMVLSPPAGFGTYPSAPTGATDDSIVVGDCNTDSLTVSNPGGSVPPTICGYNTGQHMFVPASNQCNQINIDIDTGSTSTTRLWQIKVTQYECGHQMAPEQDCLQYLTASSGTVASFNWDTSSSTVSQAQFHLSSQYYDICIRRARSYCSICYSPQVTGSATPTLAAASYGLSASSDATGAAAIAAVGATCTGVTTLISTALAGNLGQGDYLDIVALQSGTGTAGTVSTASTNRICGAFWATSGTAHATLCSWATPFKIGVHFDADEALADPTVAVTPNFNLFENDLSATGAGGFGTSGFYLAYWQNSC